MTDYLKTAELLSTAQAEIAAQVDAITRAARDVATLSAVSVGQESEAQRVRRLEARINAALGTAGAEASKLQGLITDHKQAIADELALQRSRV